jgi:hypothetical protein
VTSFGVTSCGILFTAGSHPLIHGKTSILSANHGTPTPEYGSLTAPHSRNGKNLDRVPCSGSMGNVSHGPALILSHILMVLPFRSGRWQECYLVRSHSIFLSEELMALPVPQSSRTSTICVKLTAHHLRCTIMISGRTKKWTSVGFSHLFYSNFATSPMPTTISFPLSN